MGIYIVADSMSRLKKFIQSPLPFWQVIIDHYVAMIPVFYTHYFGPALTLSAAMFSLSLLNKRNEIIPLKVAGLSMYRIITPIFGAGLFFSAVTFFNQEFLLPSMKDSIQNAYNLSHRKTSKENLILYDSKSTEFKVTRYWSNEKRGEGILVSFYTQAEKSDDILIQKRYVADVLEWERNKSGDSNKKWILVLKSNKHMVKEEQFDEQGNRILFSYTDTKKPCRDHTRVPLSTDLTPQDFDIAGGIYSQCLSVWDLYRQWKRSRDNSLLIKIYYHLTFPFTHFILLLLGIPFVLGQQNKSVFLGIIISILICVGYYVVNAMCMELGERGHLMPFVACMLPILLFGGIGTLLFDNLKT